jgi:hypothetical protein
MLRAFVVSPVEFGARPLMGERLVVPAPAGDLGEALELSGVDVVEIPLPVTPAARIVMDALSLTGCVFRPVPSRIVKFLFPQSYSRPSWPEPGGARGSRTLDCAQVTAWGSRRG